MAPSSLLLPPLLLAILLALDAWQSEAVFQDHWDGPVISCKLAGVVFAAALAGGALPLEALVAPHARAVCGAGALEVGALWWWFRALHRCRDVVTLESMGAGAVLLVPALAYLLFGDVPPGRLAVGAALACVGVLAFVRTGAGPCRGRAPGRALAPVGCMAASTLLTSLAIVVLDRAHERVDFPTSLLLQCGGYAFGGLVLLALRPRRLSNGRVRTGTIRLWIRHWRLFLCVEALALAHVAAFQRALDLGAPSAVTSINAAAPLLVAALAWLAVRLAPRSRTAARAFGELARRQVAGGRLKLVGVAGMLASVALVTGAGG